ncbi:hypothetical protein [Desulfosporosinus sp. BG]|uniref:hypothetical protein n=1 Tax=Desulfosporosinus sp. BG TaxID=1633135 RepID=UPI001A9A538E|nr:hypothetical protein [Desulfosporosinus sp. BG]
MTRVQRLYVSRISKLRESDRPQIRDSAQGPFSPSCKKANSCEDSVFGSSDGAFGTIVSSGDYRRRRFFKRILSPKDEPRSPQQELERLVCSAS